MVTVSSRVAPELVERARAKAKAWRLPYFERPRNTGLHKHLGTDASAFLVLGADGWKLTDEGGALGFSPNLAMLRLKRFDKGERDDTMLRFAELREGDAVLDCTLGLGADALVAARAVGRNGRVLGLEKSLPLWCVMSEGLREWTWPGSAAIETAHGDFAEFLARAEPKSFDVVLFDPMFERETKSSPSFDLLRRYASDDALSEESLARARSVARRWVLVKAARYSPALKRLGLRPEQASRSAPTVWARVPAA
jgi:hypothetical protein